MNKSQLHAVLRIYDYAKAYRKDILVASLYSILNTLFYILPEVLIGLAVDVVVYRQHSILARVGITDTHYQLMILGLLVFTVWILLSLFEYLYSVKWRNLSQAVQHQLRIDTYTHIQDADMHYLENV